MMVLGIVLTGLFLPLFPFSIGFNFLLGRIDSLLLRVLLLLIWPLSGMAVFSLLDVQPDKQWAEWILSWAAATALLYAYRLLTQREVNGWIGFLATSVWSLLWFPLLAAEASATLLIIYALGFSVPLLILSLLATTLKQRFGAAYTHLYGGLATTMPRFSGLLVLSVLAAIATPVFPGFFAMLKILDWSLTLATPVISMLILLTWLLWSWAGIRVLQGLLVGAAGHSTVVTEVTDLTRGTGRVLP